MSGSARIARGHPPEAAAREPAPSAHAPTIAWIEPSGGLCQGAARDIALHLVTFGFHQFWARVRLRRQVWSSVRIDGHPLAYTGTVADLLKPALIALAVLAAMAAGLALAAHLAVPRPKVAPSPWRLLVSLPLVFMIGIRLWRAKAYLLARTEWGGLPGRLHGSPLPYAATHFASAIALPLTLGWVLPWRQASMLRRLVGAIEIAGRRAEPVAPAAISWHRFWLPWLGVISVYLGAVLTLAFTMGPKITGAVASRELPALSPREQAIIAALSIASALTVAALAAWHRIGGLRAAVASVRLGEARLRLEVTDRAFVTVAVTGTAMKLASLGALAPLAEARLVRLLANGLTTAR